MVKYQETDPVKLADAISLVKNGTCGLREAARRFGIPKSTLSDHANGKIIAGSRPGRRPDLPSHVDRDATHVWGKNRKTGNKYSCHQLPFPSYPNLFRPTSPQLSLIATNGA